MPFLRIVGASLLLSSLTVPALAEPPTAGKADDGFDKLDYLIVHAFRPRPLSISIRGDGAVLVPGRTRSEKSPQLTPQELSQLRRLVAAVDWSQVHASYTAKVTDLNVEYLWVIAGQKVHLTHVYARGHAKEPPQLTTLLSFLEATAKRYLSPVDVAPGR